MTKPKITAIPARTGRPSRTPDEEMALQVAIVEAARTLFVEEGFDSVSMRKIAAKVGINPMTIYKVFENKRALLYHIWDDIFEELGYLVQKTREHEQDIAQELVAVMRCLLEYWIEHPDCYRVIFLYQDVPPEGSQVYYIDNSPTKRIEVLIDILDEGVKLKRFKPHDTVAQAQTISTHILGIALAHITIPEYPWHQSSEMLDITAEAVLSRLNMN